MSKILITGINGFIGQHIADRYIDKGAETYGIDVKPGYERCKTYSVNILEKDIVPILTEIKPDIVFNCAGLASVPYSVDHPEEDFQLNTLMVKKILDALLEAKLSDCRFLQFSSAAIYGEPVRLPIKEEDIPNPLSPYAEHKLEAENICAEYREKFGCDVRVLRIFSAYGPGLKKQIFWDMYNKYLRDGMLRMIGSGNETRDYIYIDDLIDAVSIIAESPYEEDNYIWNIASGIEVSIKQVCECFAKIMGIDSDLLIFTGDNRSCDPINWRADIDRIKNKGFTPKISMEEGIKRYIEWVTTEFGEQLWYE